MNKRFNSEDKIILAIDGLDISQAKSLLEKCPNIKWVKVGLELFVREGPRVIEILKGLNKKIFLDLKFHDIPNTMRAACFEVSKLGVDIISIHASAGLKALKDSKKASLEGAKKNRIVRSKFVFLGAGGGALSLLLKSRIPEGLLYAGFPVSGKWLICDEEKSTKTHNAKVYGRAAVGSPPMSVPHLDTRWIDGQKSLLFGPFAGFSSNFLKYGSKLDLFRSIKTTNFFSMLQAGIGNIDLGKYLLNQLIQTNEDRIETLKKFLPLVSPNDWKLSTAGQRVQIIKQTSNGGVLKMGTEVVTSSDGSLAALLGASPGASTAVTIMIEVLNRCWQEKMKSSKWKNKMLELFPSIGTDINSDQVALLAIRKRNDFLLKLI